MSNFEISDHLLSRECRELAEEIVAYARRDLAEDETLEDKRDEMMDRVHEVVDGHQWVIYNHKALMICAHCNVSDGEAFLDDVGMPSDPTIYSLATLIVYGEMRARIEEEIGDILDSDGEEECDE